MLKSARRETQNQMVKPMKPNNYLAAIFADSPVAFSRDHGNVVEQCIASLSAGETGATVTKLLASVDDEFWFPSDDWRSSYRPYKVKAGILYIPIKGVLLNDFPWQFGAYATGYKYIHEAFKRGLEDDEVKQIAFVHNSPGGAVSENFDLVDMIHANRGKKPTSALVYEMACSASYNLASAADKIIISRSGYAGSIGVMMAHFDYSKMMENYGVKVTFIHEFEEKVSGNSYEPLKESTKQRWQGQVAKLANEFASMVARNRGLSVDDIKGLKSLTFSADEALSNGLVDQIATLEDATASLVVAFDTIANQDGDEEMSDKNADVVARADHDAAVTAAFEAGKAEGLTEGKTLGVAAERDRTKAIIGSDEGKKRPDAALSAVLNTDLSAESAGNFLATLAEEKPSSRSEGSGKRFMSAMDEDGGSGVKGDDDKRDEEDDTAKADSADSIVKLASSFGIRGMKSKK